MTICENKKLIRHSLEYYKWLKNTMEKRNVEEITVKFSKTKWGTFTKNSILQAIGERE